MSNDFTSSTRKELIDTIPQYEEKTDELKAEIERLSTSLYDLNDQAELVKRFTVAIQEADRAFSSEKIGGSAFNYVLYCLLPVLKKNGIKISVGD